MNFNQFPDAADFHVYPNREPRASELDAIEAAEEREAAEQMATI